MDKKMLLEWQRLVTNGQNSDKLLMTESQLLESSKVQAKNDLRIIKESTDIMSKTENVDTFFSRLDVLQLHARHVLALNRFLNLDSIQSMEKAFKNEQNFIHEFLARLPVKKNTWKSLQTFLNRMNSKNIEYAESKFRDI